LSKRTILALPSDTHSGSTLGLIPPKQWALQEGGFYDPTPGQKLLWAQWEYNWKLIKDARKGADLIICHAGDLVEGVHHETTQIVCSRVDSHEAIADICMDKAFRMSGMNGKDKYYQISGTDSHVGNGSSSEERVAGKLDHVVPVWEQTFFDEEGEHTNGRYTWDRLYRSINGVVFDISHHGGSVGQRAWTEENGLYNKIKSIYWSCVDNKMAIPRYWIRGHNHKYVRVEYRGTQGTITGIMLPGYQIKTGFVFKKLNYTPEPADIGMVWIEIDERGNSQDYVDKIEIEQEHLEAF
jgi:hypothetical protein